MTPTQASMLREIEQRAARDRRGYGGRAWISKDPKSVIVDDRKQLLELMDYEQSMLSRSIGTDEFLDLPDGGGPSLCTQVQRMKAALDAARKLPADVALCVAGMAHWEFCPICRGNLDTGFECDNCGADYHPLSTLINEPRNDNRDCPACNIGNPGVYIGRDGRMVCPHRPEESLSDGNIGEPTACTTAEERGIAGATGAGQLPVTTVETRDSAERRSPSGHMKPPEPDESNRQSDAALEWLRQKTANGDVYAAAILAHIAALEAQRDTLRDAECLNTQVHTCSDTCQRLHCVQRREIAERKRTCDELLVHITDLTESLDHHKQCEAYTFDLLHESEQERGRLRTQLAQAEKDAARWRHVESIMVHQRCGPHCGWTIDPPMPGDDPQDAIDTAMQEQKP